MGTRGLDRNEMQNKRISQGDSRVQRTDRVKRHAEAVRVLFFSPIVC